jgi:hypothetical protein
LRLEALGDSPHFVDPIESCRPGQAGAVLRKTPKFDVVLEADLARKQPTDAAPEPVSGRIADEGYFGLWVRLVGLKLVGLRLGLALAVGGADDAERERGAGENAGEAGGKRPKPGSRWTQRCPAVPAP